MGQQRNGTGRDTSVMNGSVGEFKEPYPLLSHQGGELKEPYTADSHEQPASPPFLPMMSTAPSLVT